MTHQTHRAVGSALLVAVLAALACNFQGQQPTSDRLATAAAETVAVQLTQAASVSTQEPTAPPLFTAVPSSTPTPSATPTPTLSPTPQCTNKVANVRDVTVPDDTNIPAGDDFKKTWRMRNDGTCTWTSEYDLVFRDGNSLNGPASVPLVGNVPPGADVDLSVNLTAPNANGTYRGNWMLRDAHDVLFGLGPSANNPFWVQIVVAPTPTPTPQVAYNFVSKYCDANWVSGAGNLSCPGEDDDAEGFVIKLSDPKLENGSTENEAALETHPQWVNNGVITGTYPAFNVKNGDHFKAVIGCLYNGAACSVRFQLNYRADGGALQNLGQWDQSYDGSIQKLDVDLSSLAGKSVEFTLAVLANGQSNQDWAFWLQPRITR
jgi:hypothetical protein